MLRAGFDTGESNQVIRDGTLPKIMEQIVEQLKPEATYFTAMEGKRGCVMVFDLQDASQITASCEPLFLELGAKVTLQPVMNHEDLESGLALG